MSKQFYSNNLVEYKYTVSKKEKKQFYIKQFSLTKVHSFNVKKEQYDFK